MKNSYLMRKLQSVYAAFATVIRIRKGGSDLERWSRIENLSPEWDARTITIARMIPENSSVLEFGAGRLVLPKHLPSNCTYTPSDICDRGPGTIICDLNQRPLPSFSTYDIVVFSGVLEYINDVPEVLRHIIKSCHTIFTSYVCATDKSSFEIMRRRKAAWVNDYTPDDLIKLFSDAGLTLIESKTFIGTQMIFEFRRGLR